MALDDVVSSLVSGPRIEEAMHRTLRWIDRCQTGGRGGRGGRGWGMGGRGLEEELTDDRCSLVVGRLECSSRPARGAEPVWDRSRGAGPQPQVPFLT